MFFYWKGGGILLDFEAGLRIGELSTLKSSDIEGQEIHIRRTEVKYRGADHKWVFGVEEHAKTEAGSRTVVVPLKALDTIAAIRALNPKGEYLFEENGKRIIGNMFNKRLASVCRKTGISARSTHKIRRTYGTAMLDSNADEKFIQNQMGHRDITTTRKYYYYSKKDLESRKQEINNIINF